MKKPYVSYNQKQIAYIKEHTEIVSLISRYIPLEKEGKCYVGVCPFPHEGEERSKLKDFYVSPEKQLYHCYSCGRSGDVISFILDYKKYVEKSPMTLSDVVRGMAKELGMDIPVPEGKPKNYDKCLAMEHANEAAADYYHSILLSKEGEKGLSYFKGRGLTDATIEKFRLGMNPHVSTGLVNHLKEKGFDTETLNKAGLLRKKDGKEYDTFYNRVMFPITDRDGSVVGFNGRVLERDKIKYMNTPETLLYDKSSTLFALNFARKSDREGLILCEGNLDAIMLHQYGIDNTIATFGTAFTFQHAEIIKEHTDKVYLSFDNDEAGIKATLKGINRLREVGLEPKIINLAPYKDPDELLKAEGERAFMQRIEKALPAREYEIMQWYKGVNLSDQEERKEAYLDLASRLLDMPDTDVGAYFNRLDHLPEIEKAWRESEAAISPEREEEIEDREENRENDREEREDQFLQELYDIDL